MHLYFGTQNTCAIHLSHARDCFLAIRYRFLMLFPYNFNSPSPQLYSFSFSHVHWYSRTSVLYTVTVVSFKIRMMRSIRPVQSHPISLSKSMMPHQGFTISYSRMYCTVYRTPRSIRTIQLLWIRIIWKQAIFQFPSQSVNLEYCYLTSPRATCQSSELTLTIPSAGFHTCAELVITYRFLAELRCRGEQNLYNGNLWGYTLSSFWFGFHYSLVCSTIPRSRLLLESGFLPRAQLTQLAQFILPARSPHGAHTWQVQAGGRFVWMDLFYLVGVLWNRPVSFPPPPHTPK